MKTASALLIILGFFASLPSFARTFVGKDLLSEKSVEVKLGPKGSVVTFLSAKCPCSNSHVEELKELSKQHSGYTFLAVHSNSDEGREQSVSYFKSAQLPFPVIQDTDTKIADELKAQKTPHTFVFDAKGSVVYKGGVSNSKDCQKADRKFLREALSDLAQEKAVRTPEGRALGCAITRGGKNAW